MTKVIEPFLDTEDVRRLVSKWAIDCGGRVKARRELLGWDRRQLAALADTTEATIHRIESGALNPRDHLKVIIASALQVEAAELWPFPSREAVVEQAKAVA